jgi:hypothetical protein
LGDVEMKTAEEILNDVQIMSILYKNKKPTNKIIHWSLSKKFIGFEIEFKYKCIKLVGLKKD